MTTTAAWEHLHRAHVTTTRELVNRTGLTPTGLREYDVLDVLTRAENGMRLKHLNQYIPLTQSSLSRLNERLHHRGLITITQDPDDHRGTRLTLTPTGRAAHTQTKATHDTAIHDIMTNRLTPEELDQLAALTAKLHQEDQ